MKGNFAFLQIGRIKSRTYIDSVGIFSEETIFNFVELDRIRIESGQILPLKTFLNQRNAPARNSLKNEKKI